jgi:hypothetical protein
VPCARERQSHLLLSLSKLSLSPLARARHSWHAPLARWSDVASTLFWLQRHGWPSLDVDGEAISGEAAWRTWAARAPLDALGAVHARLVESGAARRTSLKRQVQHSISLGAVAEPDAQGAPR